MRGETGQAFTTLWLCLSSHGFEWFIPESLGQLFSFTEPSLSVWKSDAARQEQGPHAWALPTGEENGVRGGDMAVTYTVISPSHPVIKPLGDLRQISLSLSS